MLGERRRRQIPANHVTDFVVRYPRSGYDFPEATEGRSVMAEEILADTLGHPVGVREYALLAWATTSAAVVGGALGAGLESDEAVRRAAYGNREAERRGQSDESGFTA
jgi:hypothetical protein